MTLEEAKEKHQDWHRRRIEQHRKPSGSRTFHTPPIVYSSFIEDVVMENKDTIQLGVFEALAAYAVKSNICEETFLLDMDFIHKVLLARFDETDILEHKNNAKEEFEENPLGLHYKKTEEIGEMIGIPIPPTKRNGRTQKKHLKLVHDSQSMESKVLAWVKDNPKGTQTQCSKELNISRKTVSKSSPEYRHWRNIIVVLLGTGMRIGECLGLTWQSCNFNTGEITVDHTLNYRPNENGHSCSYIEFATKTVAGQRIIPMFDEVRIALLDEKQRQEEAGTADEIIDGVSGWVFTNRYGRVYKLKSINNAITRICNAYNMMERETAKKEGREPVLLPHFTCHQLRHTFCTRLCEFEKRPKFVQYVMGQADIKTTMDVYAEVDKNAQKEASLQWQGSVFIK